MKLRYECEFEIEGPACEGCPFLRYFETWDEYKCGVKDNKLIDSQVAYYNLRTIPDWCLCKVVDE